MLFQSSSPFLSFCGRRQEKRMAEEKRRNRWMKRVRGEGEYQLYGCLPLKFSGNSRSKLSPGTVELPGGRTMPGGRSLLHLHMNWGSARQP